MSITKFSNQDEAFLEVTQAIRKAADKLRSRVRAATLATSGGQLRRIPVFSWAVIAILIPLGAGLGYWDAFYREHTAYFANVITRWGLPQGVGPLTEEQVRHRNISLKFIRHGRWGIAHEVHIVNSYGAYPPAFAYFPPISLIDLNPLPDLDSGLNSELLSLCRVTFDRDGKGRILNQSGYNRANRLLYTLHYAQPDIAEYKKEGAFARKILESGITHIRFVRPAGGPDAGLGQEIRYLDSDEKPQPDHEGGYGYRQTFNPLGLPVESLALGADGRPRPTKIGEAKTTYTYDDQGNVLSLTHFGTDGQSVLSSYGVAETRFRYDRGNIIETAIFGKEGQLVTTKYSSGFAIHKLSYDDQGRVTKNGNCPAPPSSAGHSVRS
jgi:hypothetical protein